MPISSGTDEISIQESNERIHTLTDTKLNRFMLLTIVTGLLMCAALGYESIRTQLVVIASHKELQDRAAETLRERAASCAYTHEFVLAFQKFETNQALANSLDITSTKNAPFAKYRLYAFDTLFSDLDKLGGDACKGTPTL